MLWFVPCWVIFAYCRYGSGLRLRQILPGWPSSDRLEPQKCRQPYSEESRQESGERPHSDECVVYHQGEGPDYQVCGSSDEHQRRHLI